MGGGGWIINSDEATRSEVVNYLKPPGSCSFGRALKDEWWTPRPGHSLFIPHRDYCPIKVNGLSEVQKREKKLSGTLVKKLFIRLCSNFNHHSEATRTRWDDYRLKYCRGLPFGPLMPEGFFICQGHIENSIYKKNRGKEKNFYGMGCSCCY